MALDHARAKVITTRNNYIFPYATGNAFLFGEHPQIVLTDLVTPGISGLEVLDTTTLVVYGVGFGPTKTAVPAGQA